MLTVLTPAYNRRHTMGRLYDSLHKQRDSEFEWLIIDDGSTDGLEEDVHIWMQGNNSFSIRYFYVPNGGKHRAINLGVKLCNGDFIFIIDSDDYVADHAIEFINEKTALIKNNDNIAGMSFPCYIYTEDRRAGNFPVLGGYMDAKLDKAQLGITGDICMVFKRDILRKYPFPEYEGENFVSEGTMWDLIGLDGYKIRFYDEKLYFAEYLKDGLTRNGFTRFTENPKGWAAYIRTRKKCDEPKIFRMQYFFIACMRKKLSKEEICELLEISEEEYVQYESVRTQFNTDLRDLLERNHIATIAFYGFGLNARYFLVHLKEIGRDIIYGIDRKAQYVNYSPMYNLDMELPKVDCIFITIGNCTKETVNSITQIIHQKLPDTLVWTLQDMDNRIW